MYINNLPGLKKFLMYFLMTFSIAIMLDSCSSSKDVISWNVEIKQSEIPITDKCDPSQKLQSVKSPEKPKLLPPTETQTARVRVVGMPCEEGAESPVYEIPVDRVKRITYVADPLMPPVQANTNDLEIIKGCCRIRDGWWIFDKVELRGFLGYRGGKDSVIYPSPNGNIVYKSSFFGTGRGGSSMIFGFEAAGLWNAHWLDKTGAFQLGLMSGVWPVDGSTFIPVGLEGRYTFKQNPAKYSDNCNTWYLYGLAGLPFDFNTKAPVIGKSADFQRYFYGLGIGYDWAINCNIDFSVDLGLRTMNLPLPPYVCCVNTESGYNNPFRKSNALLLRFGLTF